MASTTNVADIGSDYAQRYGFHDPEEYFQRAAKGLNHEVVEMISRLKKEPEWMREFRHKALDIFVAKPMPTWGDTTMLSEINFDDITFQPRPSFFVDFSMVWGRRFQETRHQHASPESSTTL
jgi:Fe-S cluster assembly protein SufB